SSISRAKTIRATNRSFRWVTLAAEVAAEAQGPDIWERSAKSAAGLAPILLDGIGDTIRVSLLADKEVEIGAAFDILQATQRRVRRPELIACPTCGRLEIDLNRIMDQLQARLGGRKTAVKVSVLGCVVNGPGEAREADLGIAAGKGKGVIFKRGEIVRHVL